MGRYNSVPRGYDLVYRDSYVEIRKNVEITSEQCFEYVISEGETFESLAWKFYKDSAMWWVIADCNPLCHPLYLRPGMRIKILRPRYLGKV